MMILTNTTGHLPMAWMGEQPSSDLASREDRLCTTGWAGQPPSSLHLVHQLQVSCWCDVCGDSGLTPMCEQHRGPGHPWLHAEPLQQAKLMSWSLTSCWVVFLWGQSQGCIQMRRCCCCGCKVVQRCFSIWCVHIFLSFKAGKGLLESCLQSVAWYRWQSCFIGW